MTKKIINRIEIPEDIKTGIKEAAFSGVINFLLLFFNSGMVIIYLEGPSIFFKRFNLFDKPFEPSCIKYFSLISL